MTTAVRTFLISSPSAGSNRIRHTSPRTGVGLVAIQFFLAKGLKAGQLLVGVVILLRHFRRRRQDGLALLTRQPPQLSRGQAGHRDRSSLRVGAGPRRLQDEDDRLDLV